MQIFVNGNYVDDGQPQVKVADRSFRFGDGVFETVIINNGKIFDWAHHEKRLNDGLEFFGIDVVTKNIPEIIGELLARNNVKTGYGRMIISRGETAPGAVGYKPSGEKPMLVVQVMEKALPEFATIKLHVSSIRAFYHLPCKVNSSLHYVMALREAAAAGADNALLLSADGYIAETATASLFWVKGGVLYTPELALPMVPGTMRARVLELWQGEVKEGRFTLDDLHGAEEVFMANVGGIITSIGEIKPLGLKFAARGQAEALREKIMTQIAAL